MKRFYRLIMMTTLLSGSAVVMAQSFNSTIVRNLPDRIEKNDPVPLSIVLEGDLSFGALTVGTISGSLSISTEGTRIPQGGVSGVYSPYSEGKFTVYGTPNTLVTVQLPAGAFSLESGTSTMSVDELVTDTPLTTTLDENGKATWKLGGKLNVSAGQPSGNYSGYILIMVNY